MRRLLVLASIVAVAPACGGGGGGGVPAPAVTISLVNPAGGPTAGGTAITITGTGFAAGATVTVGGTSATLINVVNATTITCTTPAGSAGSANVVVTVPGFPAATSTFTYRLPPNITSINPTSGPAAGGNTVTIGGTDFGNPVASVTFGGAPASIVSQNATQIVVTAPGGPAGALTVTVTNSDSQADIIGYTYISSGPTITGLSSTDGPPVGGAAITIFGYNFGNPVTSVTFGATPATIVTQSPTRIVLMTPPGPAGPVTITVTNPGGAFDTIGFTNQTNLSPRIDTTFPEDATVHVGDTRTFAIIATDPDGDLVSLRLLNPLPGALFAPAAGLVSQEVRELRWHVLAESGGAQHLVFQASDNQAPPHVTTLTVTVRVLGDTFHSSLVVADVTGDGRLDVIAGARNADVGGTLNTGALYLWAGATSPSGTPTATLTVQGAKPDDLLGELGGSGGQGIQCADVTGDGVLDIVVGAKSADLGAIQNAGAIYVWAGGPGLAGAVAPTATLTVSNPFFNDALGGWDGQGIVIADVTGEGIPDILAGRVFQLHYWRGGPGLVGAINPTANLTGASLGVGSTMGQSINVADVTGDGILDVLAGDPFAGASPAEVGRIFLWAGGPNFGTTVAKTLSVPGAVAQDHLGRGSEQAIHFADVTGDGTLDVVVAAEHADVGGVQNAGAIYVWAGGAGILASAGPTATLTVMGAVAFDELGSVGSGHTLQVADVTGDGTADIIGVAPQADLGGIVDAGAVYVWVGGGGLTGTLAPTATLKSATPVTMDFLGQVLVSNVTGTPAADLVVWAPSANVGGVQDAGVVYVWAGGAGLTGTPAPTATLMVTGASTGDQLGDGITAPGVQSLDVTGDGTADLVVAAAWADVASVADAGAIYVWTGETGITGAPTATLTVAGASAGDALGAASRRGIQLADVTGDGKPDIVAGAPGARVAGTNDRGQIYIWAGGAGLVGSLNPSAFLTVPGSQQDDRLADHSGSSGQGVQIAEVTGDGILDIVASTRWANVSGMLDAGALYTWAGGGGLTGTVAPTATLGVTGAQMADCLGSGVGQSVRLADVTGDGIPDVVAATSIANPGGIQDAGVIYAWGGGAAMTGSPALLVTFAVPGAAAFDRLGD